jgi:bacillithiol biosynthesis cysteine-adding enzyme BshC
MSHLPEVQPRAVAPPGSLAAEILAGTAGAPLPLYQGASTVERGSDIRPVRVQASAFGSSSEVARAKLDRILAGDGQLVTTGQQPLLFLGPLFVVYKALTAIQVARAIEERTGKPALATFWIASDDHDWAEVGTTSIIDAAGVPQTLSVVAPRDRAGRPAGPTPPGDQITTLLDRFAQLLPSSDFVQDYLNGLRDAYTSTRPLGQAFADALGRVLSPFDFVWLDSDHMEVKQASTELFRRLLDDGGPAEQALERGAERLRQGDHEPPIAVLENAYPLFMDTGKQRVRLYRTPDGVRPGREGNDLSAADLEVLLQEEPQRFSPNVALRPVLESWLLPVGATVLGPGEIAYWSQLPPLFEHYGVPVPPIQPRHAWTLIEARISRTLERLGATPDELSDGGEELIARITRDARPQRVDTAVRELHSAIGPRLEALDAAVGEELPGVRSAAGKARKQVLDALGALGGRIDAAVRDREETQINGVRKCATHVFPGGKPQERIVSPFYYLARYGPTLVEELATKTYERLVDSIEDGPG